MDVVRRNNVAISGRPEGPVVMLAHGFGCDQNMWRLVEPVLAERFQVVRFDYVGSGRSDPSAWDPRRYGTLAGYAADVLEICAELDLTDVVFVGHSVSAMVGVIAAAEAPKRFARLVMVGPSRATSTTRRPGMPAGSPRRTSTVCSSRWKATIWGGRPRWPRRSWATRTVRSSGRN